VKLAAIGEAAHVAGVLAAVRPSTLRKLSHPRTSTSPVVRPMRAMAARADAPIRVTSRTSAMLPVTSPARRT